MRTQVTRLSDDRLAVVTDQETAVAAALREGDAVEVDVAESGLTVRPVARRYTLADLLKDTTPEEYRAAAVDWGPDVGRELPE
jgi:antitoxin component of MazEF toxin-antitoxin module